MSVYVNPRYRIKRSADLEEKMRELRDAKLFDSYRDMMMISALLGYINNSYEEVEKPAQDGVLMQFFNDYDYNIMDLLAFAKTKDHSILLKDDKYRIFEGYANGGFLYLLNLLEWGELNSAERKEKLVKYYSALVSGNFEFSSNIDV